MLKKMQHILKERSLSANDHQWMNTELSTTKAESLNAGKQKWIAYPSQHLDS